MIGNSGHAGESLEDPGRVAQKNEALRLGFAFAQTNTGHDGQAEPLATFASTPQKLVDYAFRAVHMTIVTRRRIAKSISFMRNSPLCAVPVGDQRALALAGTAAAASTTRTAVPVLRPA